MAFFGPSISPPSQRSSATLVSVSPTTENPVQTLVSVSPTTENPPRVGGLENTVEDIPHILKFCPALTPFRQKLNLFTEAFCQRLEIQDIRSLLTNLCVTSNPLFVNFLLDCSYLPMVITSMQQHGVVVLHHLFRVTRTWIFVLHRERLKMLGRWNKFA